MEFDRIENNEMLYRVVRKSYPDGYINGKPSAALFMDANGVSVERDGGRAEENIIADFKFRFRKNEDYKSAVKISAASCRKIGAYPIPVGNRKNIYHAEIWESENVKVISLLKAIKLAQFCKEVS